MGCLTNSIPGVLSAIALVTCFLSGLWCQTIKFEGENDNPAVKFGPWYQQQVQETSTNVGPYTSYSVSTTCTSINEDLFGSVDAKWKCTKAFSIITPIFGGLLTFVLLLDPCLYFLNAGQWKTIAILYIVFLTLFQGLTFLLFQSNLCTNFVGSDENCTWAEGSTTNVIATVCWFLTGVAMLALGTPEKPPRTPPETQTVTYERTTNPDGTSQVAEVGVVKGVAVDTGGGETANDEKA